MESFCLSLVEPWQQGRLVSLSKCGIVRRLGGTGEWHTHTHVVGSEADCDIVRPTHNVPE